MSAFEQPPIGPPGNGKGARHDAQSQDPTRHNAPQQYSCQHHTKVVKKLLPSDSFHYAKEICSDCGQLLRWVAKPEAVERQRLNSFRIARLSMCDSLSDWEREFLKSIAARPKLSPKQQACLNKIYSEHAATAR
jgi:hypothetical protein